MKWMPLTGPIIAGRRARHFDWAILWHRSHGSNGQEHARKPEHDPQIEVFRPIDFIEEMVKRGWWGEKKARGFYKRVKTEKAERS